MNPVSAAMKQRIRLSTVCEDGGEISGEAKIWQDFVGICQLSLGFFGFRQILVRGWWLTAPPKRTMLGYRVLKGHDRGYRYGKQSSCICRGLAVC